MWAAEAACWAGMWTDEDQAEADRRSEERIAAAARVMLDLSPEDLTEALERVGQERCLDCGSREPNPDAHWCPRFSHGTKAEQ